MKTMKNVMLQHVPIKLELHDEQEAETVQPEHAEQKQQVNIATTNVGVAVVPSEIEQYTDETDESEADDDEDDAIDEDEATLLISSEEEAELEAQRIRFHELLAKSLLRETSGVRNSSISCSASNAESTTSAHITPNSSRSNSIVRGARLRSRRCSDMSTDVLTVNVLKKTRKQKAYHKKKRISRKKQRQLKQQKVQQRLKIQRLQLQQLQQEQEQWRREQAQQKQETEKVKLDSTPILCENKKRREKRGSSICSVSSSLSSTTSHSEGCGCILIYGGENKLIFNCGLCDVRYDSLNSYAKHLCLSHKLIDEENVEIPETAIDIKKEVLMEDTPLSQLPDNINQELCGNIFILQRKKLFITCDYCECRYANLDLFQKHLRQHHKMLHSTTENTKRVQIEENRNCPINNDVTAVPTKKEIKTEIFIITELPAVNVSTGATMNTTTNAVTLTRTSPSCESSPSTDQPMVTIPPTNNINMNQEEKNESRLIENLNDNTDKNNDLNNLNDALEASVNVAVEKILPDKIILDSTASIPETENPNIEICKDGTFFEVSNEGQVMSLEQLKQNTRNRNQKDVTTEEKKLVNVKDGVVSNINENITITKKKRGRPKRKIEIMTTSESAIVTAHTFRSSRSKRQRKINNTSQTKSSAPDPPISVTEEPIGVNLPLSLSPKNQFQQQNIPKTNQKINVIDGKTEDTESINDLPEAVAELFKKITESPKTNKSWPISTESSDVMKNQLGVVELSKPIEILSATETKNNHSIGSTSNTVHKKKKALSFTTSSLTPSTSTCESSTQNGSPIETNDSSENSTKSRIIKSGKNQYQCEYCSKSFAKLSRCVEHTRIHTGEKPFRCDICSREFRLKMRLNEHKLRHREERAFKCEICGLALATKQDLQQHLRHHNGDRRFQCSQCPKAFVRGSDLKIHKRVHTGEKPYTCEICNKKFRANQNLTVHRRSHTLEKNFPCEICNKRFMRKVDRKVHMRTHTGEKPYKCEICQRGYSSRVHVRAHLEREHVLGFCGLKQERKGRKHLRETVIKHKPNGEHNQIESVNLHVGSTDQEVKEEQPDQKRDEQNSENIEANDKVFDCKINENFTITKSRRQTKTERQAISTAVSTTAPTLVRRVGPRKMALKTPNLQSRSSTNDMVAIQMKSSVSTPSIQQSQQVSVMVSMQVENVPHTNEVILNDGDGTDEAMPEKENDNSILSVAGVAVPTVSSNTGNSPLKAHVKNERSKITSYFTVVGQKSEI